MGRHLARGLWLAAAGLTVALAVTWPAESALQAAGAVAAVAAILGLVVIGALGDMLAVAAAAADERALHSMAARGRSGAHGAVFLKRRADRVASVAGDIVGDVAGTVSGAAAALWVGAAARAHGLPVAPASGAAVAVVAALTVGAKATLKGVALERANLVLYAAGYAGGLLWPRRRGARGRRKVRARRETSR